MSVVVVLFVERLLLTHLSVGVVSVNRSHTSGCKLCVADTAVLKLRPGLRNDFNEVDFETFVSKGHFIEGIFKFNLVGEVDDLNVVKFLNIDFKADFGIENLNVLHEDIFDGERDAKSFRSLGPFVFSI
jgi:hypothetical protein